MTTLFTIKENEGKYQQGITWVFKSGKTVGVYSAVLEVDWDLDLHEHQAEAIEIKSKALQLSYGFTSDPPSKQRVIFECGDPDLLEHFDKMARLECRSWNKWLLGQNKYL